VGDLASKRKLTLSTKEVNPILGGKIPFATGHDIVVEKKPDFDEVRASYFA
jgi:hypothetical protein